MSPELERARAIVARLSAGTKSSDEVFEAFEELDALPAEVVRAALEPWVGPAPDIDRLDDATRRAHRFPPRPLRLRVSRTARDGDVLELGDVAQEQLRLCGRSWDGVDRSPEERLDEEIEGNFVGALERRVLVDAETPGHPAIFDVVLDYDGQAGVIFRAGTTDLVGLVADHRVEMNDRRARVAVQSALDAPEPLPLVEIPAASPELPAAAATSAAATSASASASASASVLPPKKKRATAKPTAAPKKKATATKTAAKKTAAKKTAAKKTAAAPPKKKAAPKKKTAASPKKKTAAPPKKKSVVRSRG